MASTTALWFSVETAFAELEELCVQARAAELAAQKKRDEVRAMRSIGGRGYDDDQTQPIQAGRFPRAAELAKDLAFREAHPNGADLVEMRERIRKRLLWLKARFAEVLSDHEVYYALFPIVAYADELVQSVTYGGSTMWEPLQSELYEVDNGGEVFYSILDERLRQDETLPLIFEIFYFCLSDGFQGMYSHDARKIDEYKSRLAARIPLRPAGGDDAREPPPVELVAFPWQYYAIAAAAVVVVYVALALAAAA